MSSHEYNMAMRHIMANNKMGAIKESIISLEKRGLKYQRKTTRLKNVTKTEYFCPKGKRIGADYE